MAPTIIQPAPVAESGVSNLKSSLRARPLTKSGALDDYKQFDSTPAIGREFPDAQLVDLITSPQADILLRDLAITSSFPSPLPHPSRKEANESFRARSSFLPQSKRVHFGIAKDPWSKTG